MISIPSNCYGEKCYKYDNYNREIWSKVFYGVNLGGCLEYPGIVKYTIRVRDSWNSFYQGTSNFNKVVVLEEGMKFKSIRKYYQNKNSFYKQENFRLMR